MVIHKKYRIGTDTVNTNILIVTADRDKTLLIETVVLDQTFLIAGHKNATFIPSPMTKEGPLAGIRASKLGDRFMPRKHSVRPRKAAPATSAPLSSITAGAECDPVPERAAAWMARKDRLEAMIRRWQHLESVLYAKTRRDLAFDKACESELPEASAMRILNKRIEATYPELEKEAGAISALPTVSAEGALAKIELGLAVQGPFDWRDHALELVEEGIIDLCDMIGLKRPDRLAPHDEAGGF